MFGGLFALVLIKQVEDLADHIVHGVIAKFLRDRDNLHAMLCQFAAVKLKLVGVPKESGKAVNDHNIKR
ncbi:MAG TPA: hypothetical protein VIN96_05420 [Magnetovibrio sp.]